MQPSVRGEVFPVNARTPMLPIVGAAFHPRFATVVSDRPRRSRSACLANGMNGLPHGLLLSALPDVGLLNARAEGVLGSRSACDWYIGVPVRVTVCELAFYYRGLPWRCRSMSMTRSLQGRCAPMQGLRISRRRWDKAGGGTTRSHARILYTSAVWRNLRALAPEREVPKRPSRLPRPPASRGSTMRSRVPVRTMDPWPQRRNPPRRPTPMAPSKSIQPSNRPKLLAFAT
jgi:hypothetical protein